MFSWVFMQLLRLCRSLLRHGTPNDFIMSSSSLVIKALVGSRNTYSQRFLVNMNLPAAQLSVAYKLSLIFNYS